MYYRSLNGTVDRLGESRDRDGEIIHWLDAFWKASKKTHLVCTARELTGGVSGHRVEIDNRNGKCVLPSFAFVHCFRSIDLRIFELCALSHNLHKFTKHYFSFPKFLRRERLAL